MHLSAFSVLLEDSEYLIRSTGFCQLTNHDEKNRFTAHGLQQPMLLPQCPSMTTVGLTHVMCQIGTRNFNMPLSREIVFLFTEPQQCAQGCVMFDGNQYLIRCVNDIKKPHQRLSFPAVLPTVRTD